MNERIEELRYNISQLINESGLPVGVVYYILKDMVNEISYVYERAIKDDKKKSEENN